jgi:nicotinamide-nucleotide amidase
VRAEIVGVGTELLLGQIANENARYISEHLAEIGVDVLHHQAVGDNLERIASTLRLALSRADVVIVTGGLGPTQDDITREGLALAIGVRLERRPEIEAFLRERFASRGREMPEMNLQQADVPEGGRFILPERGTAPALAAQTADGGRLYLVAGVPAEMREMMDRLILPELRELAGPAVIVSRILKVAGVAESRVAEMLDDVFRGSQNPSIAYLAGSGEVKVRVTAKAGTREEAEVLIEPVAGEVARRLGAFVYSEEGEDLEQTVGRLLRERGMTVACAESLTGGSLAFRLSRAEGSSDYFLGSAVCYTAEAKIEVLGVRKETVEGHGVVSEQCAREMARGAIRIYRADAAMALTGVAGPDPHDGQPPGTVCAASAIGGEEEARTFRAPGDRAQVRRWAEQVALDMLRRQLQGIPVPEQVGPSTRAPAGGAG